VETSDGIVGWGEATLEGHTEAVEGAFLDVAERFIGQSPDNITDIWQQLYMGRFYRGGPVLMVRARVHIFHRLATNIGSHTECDVWI